MKWLKEIYDLFVDDPKLAILALAALAIGLIIAKAGARSVAGLVIFLIVAGSLWYSTRSD
ncbi:hypothetical protein [Sulfobacillus harzensis]|uniref:Uncharacterized protein n=1 Tax=Sulfobacillus harzensis TaxID=2729629 RepID=A0A7Y0Q1W7_9FIRM|nr:hypothetical protein [Sulfobacillus harzensis]NMP21271.1 hypothetical protein [Sulfobacillus harzensis]